MANNVVQFPKREKRPNHIYELDNCISCQKRIKENEVYNQIVMQIDPLTKKHVALCNECYEIAKSHNVSFN